MVTLREGFSDIVSGWMLVDDFDDLTDRIERSAEWAKLNAPLLPDEQATVELMIKTQVAKGIMRGDFDFMGLDREDLVDVISRA
jgi:hypothetical protein